jgi:hypothetical protein
MSRGLGKVQVGLLAIIERQEKAIHTYHLARLLYQPHVEGKCLLTNAQAKATYRALCSLEKRGKIESYGHRGSGFGGAYGFIWWSRLGQRSLAADERSAREIGERMRAAMGE